MPTQERITGYREALVQRDPRTHLWVKNAYLIMCIVIMLLSIITASGMIYTYHSCQDNVGSAKGFFGMSIAGIPLFLGWLVWSAYLLVNYKWTWMTQIGQIVKEQRFGEDVEDLDPGILSRSGTRTFLDATETATRTNQEVELAYRDIDKRLG